MREKRGCPRDRIGPSLGPRRVYLLSAADLPPSVLAAVERAAPVLLAAAERCGDGAVSGDAAPSRGYRR